MKRIYLLKLVILLAILSGWNPDVRAQTVSTFAYTGAVQTYLVPGGVFSLSIDMKGAAGGTSQCSAVPGYGGRVQCTLATTPGQTLYIYVGGQGTNSANTCCSYVHYNGGFNGGGYGVDYGSGGGGATDIRTVLGDLTTRQVVAGGGGAGGYDWCSEKGGDGGGLTGKNGNDISPTTYTASYSGAGGSQTTGGLGATNGPAQNGGFGFGGNGYASYYYCSGGGGGYYGGGGSYYGSGGGGSSYTDPVNALSVVHTQGYNVSGNGGLTFTANCTPPTVNPISGPAAPICGVGGTYLYSDPGGSPGGVWTSATTTTATIDLNTGILTAVGIGSTVIKYTVTYVCGTASVTTTINVNPVPSAIGGATPLVCVGGTAALLNSGGGTWSSSNTGLATITSGPPSPPGGVLTGVLAGNPIITYTLPTGCTITKIATVNPNPASITSPVVISGVPQFNICKGSTITLSDASPGGVWSSSNTNVATITAGGVVSSGPNPSGTATITYSYPSTSCYVTQLFTVNALPIVYNTIIPVPYPNNYCPNAATGIPIALNASQIGISYQLDTIGGTYGSPFIAANTTGNLWGINKWPKGTYNVVATDPASGCSSNMSGTVTVNVNALPNRYILAFVGGSTSFCKGTPGPDLQLSNSETFTFYYLYENGININSQPGSSGTPIDWGNQNPTATFSTYMVVADNGTCQDTMFLTPMLTMNDNPNVHNVTGGGGICPGNSVHVGVDFTDPGINYTLYNGTPVITLPGSSSSLDFGLMSAPGVYTAVATNATTGCSAAMAGSATVTINPVPYNAITLSINGPATSFCAGGTGIDLKLDTSEISTTYQLWNTGVLITGDTTSGTGMAGGLDMGFQKAAGTYTATATNIPYGCKVNLVGSPIINVNPLPHPYPVSGGGTYCVGGTGVSVNVDTTTPGMYYQLYNAAMVPIGGTVLGTGGSITFPPDTTGTYTVVATNPVTFCTNNMLGSATISTISLPKAYPVTGGGNYCAGGTGKHVSLGYSAIGVNYQLYANGIPVGGLLPGANSSLDFGSQTTTGTYTVMGTSTGTGGCSNNMSGSVMVTNSPNPKVYAVTASGSSYCSGDPGIDIGLTGSDPGINYLFYSSGTIIGGPNAGTGLPLDFGLQTLPGSYHVVAVDTMFGCTSNMFGSSVVTINPLPVIHSVTGGGNYCAGGTGVHVGLNTSDTWINYQLFNGGIAVSGPIAGTGSTLDFGLQTASGTYTVVGVNPLTTCTSNMSGSVTVNIKPLPNVYTVGGTGNYCAGGTGLGITLNGSDVGMTYQLYNGGSLSGPAIPGTNVALNFGLHAATGTYTIIATNTATGCTNTMTGSAVIGINPLPAAYSLYGGGSYCAGGTGVHIFLSGSTMGDNYQLMMGTTKIGGMMTATGTVLDFGAQTASGTYTAVATDALTGCSSNMLSTVNVTANPLPGIQTMTGGGHYCAGTSGVHVGLSSSVAGINYQLYLGGTKVGSLMAGGGLPLDFGLQTGAGTYTAVAIDAFSGCTMNMSGSVTVAIDPLVPPSVSISTGIGDTVCAGDVITFTAIPVNGGLTPAYSWQVNGVNKGFGATYSYVPASGDIVSVTLTSSAPCAAFPTAVNSMIVTVRPYQMPTAAITVDPGVAVCIGSPATYTASLVNGGYSPVTNWIKNSVIVGHGTSYKYTPVNNDVMIFMLGSSYPCSLADTVFSNTFKMAVDPSIAPTVTITSRPGTLIEPGQLDTFSVAVKNAGTNPTYQWYINSTPLAGETNSKYISKNFFDKDSLTCYVTSSLACGLSSYNSVIISVKNLSVRQITSGGADISVLPNPNKGEFTVKGSLGVTNNEEVSLEITNMLGQVVYNNKVMAHNGNINEHIQLGNTVANGMYILSLRSETANNVYHIVIEQ